jgi:hypothetical protein
MLVRMLRAAYAVPFKPGILDNPLRCGQISIKPVRQKPPSGFSLKKIRAFMSPVICESEISVVGRQSMHQKRLLLWPPNVENRHHITLKCEQHPV